VSTTPAAATGPDLGGLPNGRVPRALREEQLLDTALSLFAASGYEATSIVDIAAAAAVTRPVVYRHFGSKDGIYLACLRRARSELDDRLASAVAPETDAEQRLRAGIGAYFSFVEEHGREWDVLFGGGMPKDGPAAEGANEMRHRTSALLTGLLKVSAPDVDAQRLEVFGSALNGMGVELARWWRRNPGITRDEMVEHYFALCWDGLRVYVP
jgi:AcrR family transcriptional regulator